MIFLFKSYKICLVDVLKPFSAIHTKWGVEQNILIQATGGHVIGKKTIQFVLLAKSLQPFALH